MTPTRAAPTPSRCCRPPTAWRRTPLSTTVPLVAVGRRPERARGLPAHPRRDARSPRSPAGATSATAPGAAAEGDHLWTVDRPRRRRQRAERRRRGPSWSTARGRPRRVRRRPPTTPACRSRRSTLSWTGASDGLTGVAQYRVIVDGVAVRTLPGTARVTGGADDARRAHLAGAGDRRRRQRLAGRGPASSRSPASRRPPSRATGLAGRLPSVPAGRAGGARPAWRAAPRVSFAVRPASTPRALGSFTQRLAAGPSRFTLPAGLSHRLRAGRTYVMTARGGGSVDSVRFTIRGRARR